MTDEPKRRQARPRHVEPLTAVIAERVRYLRENAGMNQEELAEALNKVGVPWKRATVGNLESRAPSSRAKPGIGRDAITVEELIGLALVLGVPPVGLLMDLRNEEPVPLTTEVSAPPMEAVLWAIGRRPITELPHAQADAWYDLSIALDYVWRLEASISGLESMLRIRTRDINPLLDGGDDLNAKEAAAAADRVERSILEGIAAELKNLTASRHPHPKIPEIVWKRAAELGISLEVEA